MSRYSSSDSWHKRVQIRLEFCYPVEDVPYLSGVSPEPPCTPEAALPCQIHTHIHTGIRLISVPRTALFANSFLVCTDTFIFLSVTCSLSPTPAHLPYVPVVTLTVRCTPIQVGIPGNSRYPLSEELVNQIKHFSCLKENEKYSMKIDQRGV